MTSGAVAQYRGLIERLLLFRVLVGGALSEDEELAYVEALDACYRAMSLDEQETVDNEPLPNLEAPVARYEADGSGTWPAMMDVPLETGAATLPREARRGQ